MPCWDIKCSGCGKHYQIGMVPLPLTASPSALDEDLRERRRNDKRRRFGYTEHGTKPRPQRITSDTVKFTITIKPGRVTQALHHKIMRHTDRRKRNSPNTLEVA